MHGPSPYAFIRQSGLNWGVRSGCACTVPASDHDEEMERRKAELLQHKAEAARKAEEEFAKQPKYIGTIDVRVGGFVVDPRTGSHRPTDGDRATTTTAAVASSVHVLTPRPTHASVH